MFVKRSFLILMIFLFLNALVAQDAALQFDGVNDYVDLTLPLTLNSGEVGSFSCWFKTSQPDGVLLTNDSVAGDPDFTLQVTAAGRLRLEGYYLNQESEILSEETVDDGLWHHAVAIKIGSLGCVQLYLDSVDLGQNCNAPIDDFDHGANFFLGSLRADGQGAFEGLLDEVSIYNRVLDSDDVAALFSLSELINDGLAARWHFNENSGITAADDSGNSFDAEIVGASWITDYPVSGCTNALADNYNPEANVDDGSCNIYTGPVWFVSLDGTDAEGGGSELHPYETIQYAVDNAAAGDTVLVTPGTYSENLFISNDVILTSEFVYTLDQTAIESTIISGNSSGSAIIYSGVTQPSELNGFTITDGWALNGGGIYFLSDNEITFKNLLIAGNEAYYSGGGIYMINSDLTLINCTVTNNLVSENGGGILALGSSIASTNSIFWDNENNQMHFMTGTSPSPSRSGSPEFRQGEAACKW